MKIWKFIICAASVTVMYEQNHCENSYMTDLEGGE